MKNEATFSGLIDSIRTAHQELAAQAGRAINISLTLRNWLIGYYIAEYELNGKDRAEYGEKLLPALAAELRKINVIRSEERELRRYWQFYQVYPQIRETLPPKLGQRILQRTNSGDVSRILGTVTPQSEVSGKTVVSRLSFSHICELIAIDDPTKRAFYEVECIRENWSVRELKRSKSVPQLVKPGIGLRTAARKPRHSVRELLPASA